MNKLPLLVFNLLVFMGCHSQVTKTESTNSLFSNYVKSILEDSSNRWKEYPKPPALTIDVLNGLEQELKDDSAKYYFEQLSFAKFKSHQDYTKALNYFENHRNAYCTLALTAHWNPDARVSALLSLNKRIKMRPLICTTKAGYDKLEKEDLAILEFLIYLLESNPVFISGSENATIHGYYMSNIIWNIDLLTHENITGGKHISEWYKNDLQYESDILKWKQYLHNKK